jgi:endogenous inhibitor of DNA gyrase (YacG/DUF329 family)
MTSKKLTANTHNPISQARASATSRSVMTVKCPTCGNRTAYSKSNPCRPFCSRNCAVSDLAAWASDEYRVPASTPAERQANLGFDHAQGNDHEFDMENRSDESDQD